MNKTMTAGETALSKTVEIEEGFYHKLITLAHDSFVKMSFRETRDTLAIQISNASNYDQLMTITKDFIEAREFVDKVVGEYDRLSVEAAEAFAKIA